MSDEKFNPEEVNQVSPDVSVDDAGTINNEKKSMTMDEMEESLDNLSHGLNQFMNAVQQELQGLSQWAQHVNETFFNHNIRLNVFEKMFTAPEYQEVREAFVRGDLKFEDFKNIAEKDVLPQLQEEQKKAQEAMEKQMQEAAEESQDSLPVEDHQNERPGPRIVVDENDD